MFLTITHILMFVHTQITTGLIHLILSPLIKLIMFAEGKNYEAPQ